MAAKKNDRSTALNAPKMNKVKVRLDVCLISHIEVEVDEDLVGDFLENLPMTDEAAESNFDVHIDFDTLTSNIEKVEIEDGQEVEQPGPRKNLRVGYLDD